MILKYGTYILLLANLPGCTADAVEEEKRMSNEQNVLSMVETMTQAFHRKDIKSVLASYEDGAAVMFEPAKKVSGKEALQKMFEDAFQLNPRFEYPNGHEVYTAGDIALHIAPWTMKGKDPNGADIQQSGLSVAVLRRQTDGKWLLILDNPHGQLLMNK